MSTESEPGAPEIRRLTQYAAGGGCACKIPAGRLEEIVKGFCRARYPGPP